MEQIMQVNIQKAFCADFAPNDLLSPDMYVGIN